MEAIHKVTVWNLSGYSVSIRFQKVRNGIMSFEKERRKL